MRFFQAGITTLMRAVDPDVVERLLLAEPRLELKRDEVRNPRAGEVLHVYSSGMVPELLICFRTG